MSNFPKKGMIQPRTQESKTSSNNSIPQVDPNSEKVFSNQRAFANPGANNIKKPSIADEIEKIKHRREERRKKFDDDKRNKIEMMNNPDYIPKLDTDYEQLIKNKKATMEQASFEQHVSSENSKIFVCVRKRPIFQKEILNGEIDCVTSLNPKLCVYECKMKIDGITKYIDSNEFFFDNVFGDFEDTETVYQYSILPSINLILQGGVVTCFAYGQTGSGKTYTMKGVQNSAIDSIFEGFSKMEREFDFYVSFFEIYGGRLYDLLNNRNKVSALEDKNQKVQIFGLEEKQVFNSDEMKYVVEFANTLRTTHNTVTNETSSRSHAICNFVIKEKGRDEEYSKLTLVDLAGSERAQETQSNDKNRLVEGAEINKSLLALKECIRALDARKVNGNAEQHVPFRASKLTLVLRDSFISKSDVSKIIMIACVSPGYSSANHTINTLRYSDRLKEKTSLMNKNRIHENNFMKVNCNDGVGLDFKRFQSDSGKEDNFDIEDNMQKLNFNPIPISKPTGYSQKPQQGSLNNNKTATKKTNSARGNEANTKSNEWEYLKKSIECDSKQLKPVMNKKESTKCVKTAKPIDEDAGDNKFISDDFIKYNEINDKILEDEEEIIASHMNIIKEDATLLTEEGELISCIKGVGQEIFQMDEYTQKLEQIITKKISIYMDLKKKMETYKEDPT